MSNEISIKKEDIVELVNEYLPNDKKVSQDSSDSLLQITEMFGEKISNALKNDLSKDYEYASDWLALAKSNLNSSKILHSSKQYADSMNLLQQSVEKLVKAYCIAFHLFSEEEIRKISHKSPMAFVKMLKIDWVRPTVNVMKEHYPSLKTDTRSLEDTLHNKDHELAQLPPEPIEQFLTYMTTINNALTKKNKEIRRFIKKIVGEFEDVMDENQKEGFRFLIKHFDMRLAASFINLYLLSTITYPHFRYSRYPDLKLKPSIYTKELGIVKTAPKIFPHVEKGILQLEKYLYLLKEG